MSYTSLILSGNAFKNPYDSAVASLKGLVNLNGLTSPSSPFYVAALANAFLENPLTTFTPSKVTSIAGTFTDMISEIDELVNHTDKLSGVDISGDTGLGNMAQIMTVARAVSGESSCSEFNKAFGAIAQSAVIIALIMALIDKIMDFLENPEEIVDELLEKLEGMINQIVDQIASDLEAYAQGALIAIANALSSSISGLISDPCFSAIFDQIASDEMKSQIETKIKMPEIPRIEL